MSELYRDFIDRKADQIITDLGGTITPAPSNAELYRDFLGRKFDDVITALNGSITPAPAGDELYRDFIERKFDDVITGIGGYVPPVSFPTVSGSICSFNSAVAGLPLKSHTVALTATQSGSGTPSPSNPRPISGYSAINISHSDADTSNPTVYTIQIGSTVYGGYYDARTGVLTVTHGVVDLGTLNWGYSNSVFNSSVIAALKSPTNNIICTSYKTVAYSIASANMPDKSIKCYGGSENKIIYIKDINYTDPAVFKTAMNGVQLMYPLATPTTLQLPPCPIDTLLGVNNIFADTGDTTLQYIKIGGNT